MEEVAVQALSTNLVLEAVKIMVVGMVTVFAFLGFMVIFLKIQGWFLTRFFPQNSVVADPQANRSDVSDSSLIAVITAAISQYKKQK